MQNTRAWCAIARRRRCWARRGAACVARPACARAATAGGSMRAGVRVPFGGQAKRALRVHGAAAGALSALWQLVAAVAVGSWAEPGMALASCSGVLCRESERSKF